MSFLSDTFTRVNVVTIGLAGECPAGGDWLEIGVRVFDWLICVRIVYEDARLSDHLGRVGIILF